MSHRSQFIKLIQPTAQRLFLALLLTLVTGATASNRVNAATDSAPTPATRTIDRQLAALLVKLDANKDGKLSREEAQAIADGLFKNRDVSKNGSLEKSEYRGWLQKRLSKTNPKPEDSTITHKNFTDMLSKKFSAADRDGDGSISRIEFAGWKQGKSLARFLDPKPMRTEKSTPK